MTETQQPIYTSRIIKASALLADTKVLLAEWDLQRSVDENLDRARLGNIFGKATRRRVEDILRIFRQRYFDDPDVGFALVTLAQHSSTTRSWPDSLLYFFSAQNDRTLRDMVVEVLYPRHLSGYMDAPTSIAHRAIHKWISQGKTTTAWGDNTVLRVVRNTMAALRDFGVLAGDARKQLAPLYLPLSSFALVALWLQNREHSGDLVLRSDEWKLFFLSTEGVERFFVEAHQEHLLNYQAAGSVVRIEFPAASLTEYAHVLIEAAR